MAHGTWDHAFDRVQQHHCLIGLLPLPGYPQSPANCRTPVPRQYGPTPREPRFRGSNHGRLSTPVPKRYGVREELLGRSLLPDSPRVRLLADTGQASLQKGKDEEILQSNPTRLLCRNLNPSKNLQVTDLLLFARSRSTSPPYVVEPQRRQCRGNLGIEHYRSNITVCYCAAVCVRQKNRHGIFVTKAVPQEMTMSRYCSEFSTSVGFAMAVSLNRCHQVSTDWSGSRFLRFRAGFFTARRR